MCAVITYNRKRYVEMRNLNDMPGDVMYIIVDFRTHHIHTVCTYYTTSHHSSLYTDSRGGGIDTACTSLRAVPRKVSIASCKGDVM